MRSFYKSLQRKFVPLVLICITSVQVSNAFAEAKSCEILFSDASGKSVVFSVRKYEVPYSQDPYEILGLGRDASPNEIKARYRVLAKLYHPDKGALSEGSGEKFLIISEAYERLTKSINYQFFAQVKDVFELLDALIFKRPAINYDKESDFLKVFFSELTGFYPLLHQISETAPMYRRAADFKTKLSHWMKEKVAKMSETDFNHFADIVADRIELFDFPAPPFHTVKSREARLEWLQLQSRQNLIDIENTVLLYAFFSSPRSLERPEILQRLATLEPGGASGQRSRGRLTVITALSQPFMQNNRTAWQAAAEILPGLVNTELSQPSLDLPAGFEALGETIKQSSDWQRALNVWSPLGQAFNIAGYRYFLSLSNWPDGSALLKNSSFFAAWIEWPGVNQSYLDAIKQKNPELLNHYLPNR